MNRASRERAAIAAAIAADAADVAGDVFRPRADDASSSTRSLGGGGGEAASFPPLSDAFAVAGGFGRFGCA